MSEKIEAVDLSKRLERLEGLVKAQDALIREQSAAIDALLEMVENIVDAVK